MKTDTPETDAETWKAGDLRIGSKVCADFARKLERELATVTAQRDMLAVALNDVINSGDSTTMYRTAKEALQSLTQNVNVDASPPLTPQDHAKR
jgi:hypothetical protein